MRTSFACSHEALAMSRRNQFQYKAGFSMYFILVRKSSSFYLTRHSSKKISGLFALLEVDSAAGHSNDTKTIVRNLAVEITKGGRQSLECDEIMIIEQIQIGEAVMFFYKT